MKGGKTLWLQARRCIFLFSSSLIPKQRNRQRRDDEGDAMCGSAPRPSHGEGWMQQHRGVERGTAPHPLPLPEQELN